MIRCLLVICTAWPLAAHAGYPSTWTSRGMGGGGGLYGIAINPLNPLHMHVSCDMSDFFVTFDGGTNWQRIDFRGVQTAGQDTIAQFATDPATSRQRIYILRRTYDATEQAKADIAISSDGLNWSQVPGSASLGTVAQMFADPNKTGRIFAFNSTVAGNANLRVSQNADSAAPAFSNVSINGGSNAGTGARIAGMFCDGNTIYLATSYGFLISTNGGTVFTTPSGVGVTQTGEGFIHFAGAKDPATGRVRLYGIAGPRTAVNGQGQTVTLIDISKRSSGLARSTNRIYTLDYVGGVAQSTTWTDVTGNIPVSGTIKDFPNMLAMSQDDIGTVYAACQRNGNYPDNQTVYKASTNNAVWTAILATANNQNVKTGWAGISNPTGIGSGKIENGLTWSIPDGFACAPRDASRVVLCDNSVIHVTTNGGGLWTQLYTKWDEALYPHPPGSAIPHGHPYGSTGLDITVTNWIDWRSAQDLWIGATDIKTMHSTDGGQTFAYDFDHTGLPSGDVYMNLGWNKPGHPWDGARIALSTFLVSPYSYLGINDSNVDAVPSSKPPGIFYLLPNSTGWQALKTDWIAGTGNVNPLNGTKANPVWFTLDPPRDRIFVCVAHSNPAIGGIWRGDGLASGASGVVWTHLTNPVARVAGQEIIHPYNLHVLGANTLVASYSARQFSGSTTYLDVSGIFYSSDGGQSWNDVSDPAMRFYTQDLVIDPHDTTARTWYACVWGTGAGTSGSTPYDGRGGLYRTTTAGQSWTPIWSGDAVSGVSGSVTSATINPDPQWKNEMYVCTKYGGLYYTSNLNDPNGPAFIPVANYAFRAVDRVFFNPYISGDVWIASYGNGLQTGSRSPTFAEWTQRQFPFASGNLAISGKSADPDGDGLSNAVECALGMDPNRDSTKELPGTTTWADAGGAYAAIAFSRNLGVNDVTLTVQVSNDLANWSDGCRFGGNSEFSTSPYATLVSRSSSGGSESIIVRVNSPLAAGDRWYFRLAASAP